MPSFRLSPAAERDLEEILAWSHEHFGEEARVRYEARVVRGLLDLAEDPERVGSRDRPEIAPGIRTYHLTLSRDRVERRVGRVGRPRHLLLYRQGPEGEVQIVRILHESMDLPRHLPEE